MEPLRTQLGTGSPTSGSDCAPVTGINGILWASRGEVGPVDQTGVRSWVHQFRLWGGAPTSPFHLPPGRDNAGMLFRTEVLKAYRNLDLAKAMGRHGHRLTARYFYQAPWKAVIEALSMGYYVHLPIDYGVLREGDAPMGSRSFRGKHSVALAQYRKSGKGKVYTMAGDPLFDHRPIPGPTPGRYPDGWTEVRAPDYAEAAAAWCGMKGMATFIVLERK